MGWNDDIVWYEEDDKEALVSEFVRLSALYHRNRFSSLDLAREVWKNSRDGDTRFIQAACVWDRTLAIQERIRIAIQNGGTEPKPFTKEQWELELLALARDTDMSPTAKKAKVDAYKAIAESKGWLVKPSEAGANDPKVRPNRRIFIAKYEDA